MSLSSIWRGKGQLLARAYEAFVLNAPDLALSAALMEGKPIRSSTPFGKGIMHLADRLSGRAEGMKKPSSLGGLFGLFSKTSKT